MRSILRYGSPFMDWGDEELQKELAPWPTSSTQAPRLRMLDYTCHHCGHKFEELVDVANTVGQLQQCPKCGAQVEPLKKLYPHPKHASWTVK